MRSSSDVPDASPPDTAPFNPLVALQSLLSGDVVGVKQRVKAAQQLDEYFRGLTPTPGLLLSYEPYLPMLTAVMVTPVKGGQELQTSVSTMLQTLSSHNPTGFSDWIAKNTQIGNEPWLVQWSYALLLQVEKTVPRENDKWIETSVEFNDFDRVFTRVLHMWRTVLDHTAEVALVDQLVKYLQALLMQTDAIQWQMMVLKKLQTHFVDIADVFIGWMMSTGPYSPLRQEILTLLHHFGRLWADNSVFSLQLLNSFADEIVNLCDSWDNHVEGDDDRLSTLLVCFMMVSQCVPDLALPSDEDASNPFERVLNRVVSCSQPEYSLFCVANCSDYLVSISSSRYHSFLPLSVMALRFLLYHSAVQSRSHDSEVDKLSAVMENACKLASANFPSIDGSPLTRTIAIGVLEDEIPSQIIKKGGQPKRVKVMECLFHMKCANAVAYTTQLCMYLMQLGGIGALKALGARALQRLNGRNGDKGNSYYVFVATCFILVSRNPEKLNVSHADAMDMIEILELITTKLEKQSYRHHKLTPRQLCLVLKMACAFIDTISRWIVDRINIVETVSTVLLRMLECAISILPDEALVVVDHQLSAEALKVIDAVISQTKLIRFIPQEVYRDVLKKVTQTAHSMSIKAREESIQVLETLSSRAEALEFAGEVFEVLLDLLLDPSRSVQTRIIPGAFGEVARFALFSRDKLRQHRYISQALHPSFVGADFESIMSQFQSRECDEREWHRVCGNIISRTRSDVTLSNSGILLGAIHQAAAWCVQNRLRTHFGGPAQSFARIEHLLQEYSDEVQHKTGWSSQNNEAPGRFYKTSYWLSNWLMLEFVGALELRISRAIYTTDVDQNNSESDAYKTVLFYRTNKGVCDDWLNRIRPFLVEMSKNGSSYELCRYHSHSMMMTCYSKLSRAMVSFTSRGASEKISNELKQAERDLDFALYSLCRCHCDAKDPDAIIGFQRWGESISCALSKWYELNKGTMDISENQCKMPLFRWLSAVRYEAEMRYADAATEYESLLEPVLRQIKTDSMSAAKIFESPMTYLRISPPALLGCIKQCAKCYTALRDWAKLRQFVTEFVEFAKFLEDYDRPIEGIQEILGFSNMWRDEIGNVYSLETGVNAPTEQESEVNGNICKRTTLMLGVWDAINQTDLGGPSAAPFFNNVADRLRKDLIPVALSLRNSENVGKKTEETLLRMLVLSNEYPLSTGYHRTEVLAAVLRRNPEFYDSATWGQPFCTPTLGRSDGQGRDADANCLYLTCVARLARKQHNFGLAHELLREAAVIEGASRISSMTITFEKSRLLETIGMEDEGRRLLVEQCETSLKPIISNDKCSESATVRSLLHLSTSFAKADNMELTSSITTRFLEGALVTATSIGKNELSYLSVDSLSDEAAYKCLQAAVTVSPESAKAWIQYSHWCYDRGRREIERITDQNGYIHLDPTEESEMNVLLDEIGIVEPDRDGVVRAFCHFLDNGDIISQRLDEFHQMCTNRAPVDHDSQSVDRLIQLQQACRSKVLRFHVLAARGYGEYLKVLQSASRQETIMVTLRLLDLLTAYGAENVVVSELEEVLSNGPVAPWSYVVPQLIARARHPIVAVSSLVFVILKRLAHHSPHAIVYPAVVDSMEPQATLSNLEEKGIANNTFAAVLQELKDASSGQVEGVRLLISELRRISILWDEAWISTLVKLSTDVSRRTSTLEKEASRVEKNASLSSKEKNELAQRKLVAIMKPIYVSIERLWKETCGSVNDQHAVSPHERKFLKDYGGLIQKAIDNFRDCCNSEMRVGPASGMNHPQELWQPFADLLKALMNVASRREQLSLHEISPAMASTSVQLALTNMPGAFSRMMIGQMKPTTIHHVNSSVAVLRTKTKPKSLILIGTDGETYKYLLKAREDLRLDERIMQFLRVTNAFLRANGPAAARDLSAQSYNVIPISRNAGLIEMVPDVVPLFQVYSARNDSSGRTPQDHVTTTQQQPPPPTAQFYAKLKQHGIANVAPNHRSQWPVSVLKQVYQELVAQRPRNVLHNEILFRSDDVRESWTKNLRLSKSLAVMSVLGYIIGLGDRHLDNILLCVNSGDIVHIDYNVCFDKGRRLKVPEIVPFRLTPMLQDALGVTGVEGSFRVALETTLRVVRSDDVREALLTLLQAFVYSPLVDWIAEDKRQQRSGDLKARLEVNVNLSLFLSRAEERRLDTISFGRQYEQYADIISRVLKGAEIPLTTLLKQRKHLLSLEREEQALLEDVSRVEAELSKHQSVLEIKRAEVATATALTKEIAAKMTSFANECLARHQQIEMWRQKCINFAEGDPQTQLSALTKAAGTASFQKVLATLNSVLEQTQFASQQRELLAALENKCQAADVDVVRLSYEIEKLATDLIPYLSYYGHQRKELDAYLDCELKLTGKDVYFKWWGLCTEWIRGQEGDQNTGIADAIVTGSVPSEDSVAESTVILRRIGELCLTSTSQSNDVEETSYYSQADKLLEHVWNELSAMKLSNAQGQRLLKLAGASWIIGIIELFNEESCASDFDTGKPSMFTPALIAPSKFGIMVSVIHTCSTLFDVVSTPKGSMKRLRASELLASVRESDHKDDVDKSLNGFNDILQATGRLAVVLQEEYLSNLHGRQVIECTEQLWRIKEILATPDGMQDLMNAILMPPTDATDDVKSLVQKLIAEHPVVHNVFAAIFAIIQKISTQADTLHRNVLAHDDLDGIKTLSSASWIAFAFNFIELFTATEVDKGGQTMEAARMIWSAQMNDFVTNCLVKLLQYQLSSIISSDWEFDVLAGTHDSSGANTLNKRWNTFFSSKILDILPSTLMNQPNGTSESHAREVSKSFAELMAVCERWWSHQWSLAQRNSWVHRVSSLRIQHERRLRYAAWLTAGQAEVESASLSRIQLLTFLSSQVPQINALLADQVVVETSVLELAQQMDYLASSFDDNCADSHSADDNLHTLIQNCYGKVAGIFGYGHILADLVQGISVIETSSGEFMTETEKIELEVDIAGYTLLQTASKVTLEIQSSQEELNKIVVQVRALKDEVKSKHEIYDALAKRKHAVENELHTLSLENKSVVLEIARVLSKNVKEMRSLFKLFDKLKTPSKQHPAIMGLEGFRRQGQATTEQSDSPSPERPSLNAAATFCFMENDRLVKILLRSIRSINHLQLLEGVLEKHGKLCASLRGTVFQLDQVLRDFDVQADKLLIGSQNDCVGVNTDESSLAFLLLQLLLDLVEALRVVTNEPQPGSPSVSKTEKLDDPPISLLVAGRDLVRGCVKMFFEATDMADRLSSTQDESRIAGGSTSLPDDDVEDEQIIEDSTAPAESANSTMGDSNDSGSNSHIIAGTPRSVEEKSEYGLQVLKRIEEKLSGTVTEMADASLVLTVEQQTSWLIDEATKTDNLCVMYEGWTPWI